MTTFTGGLYGQTETSAAYTEAEQYHPARLLGVAQAAMEQANRLTDPDEIHAVLTGALERMTPPEETT